MPPNNPHSPGSIHDPPTPFNNDVIGRAGGFLALSLWCAQGTGFIHPPLSIHCGVTQDAHAPPTLSNIVCCFFSSSHSSAKLPLASDTPFFSLFTHIALALFPRDLSAWALLDTALVHHMRDLLFAHKCHFLSACCRIIHTRQAAGT